MSTANRTISLSKRVTQTGVGASDWIVLNKKGAGLLSIQVEASGTATINLQGTLNVDITGAGDTVPASEINNIEDMTALAVNGLYSVQGPLRAIRINQTVGAGTSAVTVLQVEGS